MNKTLLSIGSILVILGLLLSSCGQSPTPTPQATPQPSPASPQVTETKKGSVSGNVWHDQNQDATRDAKEKGLANWTIYIDSNNNNKLDAGERKTSTNAAGDYSFSNLAPGAYNIRQILPEKWASSEALLQNNQQGNKGRSSLTPQVINGSASNTSYPWMTGLISRGNTAAEGHFCGGALIAPRFVLTAAHCIEDETANGVDVLIGATNLGNESTGERIQVKKIYSNPNYKEEDSVLLADVAVLELARASTKTPVNLITNTAIQNTGAIARVMGWGNRSTTGEDFPLQLHEVDVPVRSDAECTTAYNKNGKNYDDAWICAAPKQGGKDSCQGDSGGPLVIKSGGVWNHVGIVSFGEGCALETHPGVYAQTSTYLPWIKSITTGISTPQPTPNPQPTPQPEPTPQPTPVPNPQPIAQPTPVPNPQPTPEPLPDPIVDEPYDDFYDDWDWYYFIEIFEDEIFDDIDFGNYYW